MARRRRKTLKKPLLLGDVIAEGRFGKKGSYLVHLYKIQETWPEIVGEMLASRTFPKRVRGQSLIVAAENPAWAQHLTMMKEELLGVIEKRAGIEFKDLRFSTEVLPPRKKSSRASKKDGQPSRAVVAKPVPGIADPELALILGRVKYFLDDLKKT